jgi:hypothetical protein
VILHLFQKQSDVEEILGTDNSANLIKEIDGFKRLCRDTLQGAVNKAKSSAEIQVDLLSQIAIVKMLTEGIRSQYKGFIENLNDVARKCEVSRNQDRNRAIKIKEKYRKTKTRFSLMLAMRFFNI